MSSLLEELLPKMIPYFIVEWKYGKQIDFRVLMLLVYNTNLTA